MSNVRNNSTSSSFIQCNGNRLFINGEQYDSVTRVVLETSTKKRITLPGEYASVKIKVEGDCGRIESASGDVTVNGDCREGIKTMSGNVFLTESCQGSVNTMSGSVNVLGSVAGSVSSMSGSISHTASKFFDKFASLGKKKPPKEEKVKQEEKKKKKREEERPVKKEKRG